MRSHGSPSAALRIGTPGLTKPRKRGGMSMHTGMLPQNHTTLSDWYKINNRGFISVFF